MAPNPRRQDAALDPLYAELPSIECVGRCWESCGPVEASLRERARIEVAAGVELTCGFGPSCSLLIENRCSQYELRPMICRLWGLSEAMPCVFGCKPERLLSDEETRSLLERADAIGGKPPHAQRMARLQAQLERALIPTSTEDITELLGRIKS